MRHVRILGLSLVAAFAMSAMAAGQATAACVKYGERCETLAEHEQFQAMAYCPFEVEGLTGCDWAQSRYKTTWKNKAEAEAHSGEPEMLSEFTAGNVTVPLKLPITLRGGVKEVENAEEIEEQFWFGAEGAETIQPVAQKAPPLTKDVDTALLSQSERERYDYYVKIAKETKTTATVELAGPATNIVINEGFLLDEEGTAFGFPVKVKLSNPFVGNNCYVGSDTNPIVVDFTTGPSGALHGKAGQVHVDHGASMINIWGTTLVSEPFAVPAAEGCGAAGGADAAINAALGLPAPEGNKAILNGVLKQSGARQEKLALEGQF